ncbi:MAG TPA: ABC transporter permease [Deinococcales bacterium]|nr:ABC transporter permease [Deinococcales bacterium]
MFGYLIRRLLLTVLTVLGSLVVLFIIIRMIPGDPAVVMLGPRASEGMISAMRERMLLDEPFMVQLGQYVLNILRGDMGTDVLNNRSIGTMVFEVLPATMMLAFFGILTAVVIGIPLGTWSAANRNTFLDRIIGILSVAAISVPPFVAGLLLLLLFSIQLGWFPVSGAGKSGDIVNQLRHLVLPVTALALTWIGYIARLVRTSVLEELGKDHVRTATAKGLDSRTVLFRHTLRGALIPVIVVIGVGFGNLLGGAVLIELVFNRPGLGHLILNAIESRNYPVVQGALIVAVFLYSFANLLADLSYGLVDPRIRTG